MGIDPVTGTTPTTAAAPDAATDKAATGFEELLVQQLAQALVDSTGAAQDADAGADDATGGDGTDATTSLLQSFLPDALAQSVTAAGGLGLAPSLASALRRSDA